MARAPCWPLKSASWITTVILIWQRSRSRRTWRRPLASRRYACAASGTRGCRSSGSLVDCMVMSIPTATLITSVCSWSPARSWWPGPTTRRTPSTRSAERPSRCWSVRETLRDARSSSTSFIFLLDWSVRMYVVGSDGEEVCRRRWKASSRRRVPLREKRVRDFLAPMPTFISPTTLWSFPVSTSRRMRYGVEGAGGCCRWLRACLRSSSLRKPLFKSILERFCLVVATFTASLSSSPRVCNSCEWSLFVYFCEFCWTINKFVLNHGFRTQSI